ncbi:hypothetical protein L1987_39597 [Smallanthus sonchifolius]|uniref:Uncharacterized protein n=1 Tax=Smallanthus sonchifolius TaxID=185202 RepID=A0ACB9HP70_9ASTR|nr:hypothetical protein L1987_39597 [Smallanthus sonchifolius]
MENVQHLKIPLEEIQFATNNFSDENFIGRGGFGKVYIGKLNKYGQQNTVAVKRLDHSRPGQGEREFLMEIIMLSSYKHKNLISLVGFCQESGENILVYEYAKHESLKRYIADDKLSWMQRLKISLGAARGFNYLHNDVGPQHRVLHGDIKSSNILLDENWEAKIFDFGSSKIDHSNDDTTYSNSTIVAAGTFGYIDPQYFKYGILTKESDVYSFGVVLFEILCGRLALVHTYKDERRFLPSLAKQYYEQNRLHEIILPSIKNEIEEDSSDVFSMVAYQCLKEKRSERPTMAWIVEKLEEALEQQHHRYRLEDILSATNNFSDENLITEDALGKVYKGQLLQYNNLMNVAIRRFDCKYGKGDDLQMEISMLKTLKHNNIASMFRRYDENNEKIIIYKQAFHGTLHQHLSDPSLTWSQRLQICLGVAHALSYIHYDVIHCDIRSSKIFLDKDWEPKIYGFELSTKYPQSWTHRVLFASYFDTNNVTPTYDVYCFGVLLFEVLCGRKPLITNEGVEEELDKIIDPKLRKQIDTESLALFTNIAHNCLKQQLVHRPTMDHIVKQLEEVLELQCKHANLEPSIAAEEGTSSNSLKILKIPLSEIKLATNDFDDSYYVGCGGYGIVYKAKLDVLDIQNLSWMDGKCEGELPKITKTVAIKRIYSRTDEQGKQGFLTELELLTTCKHPNIVSLLGFSREAREMILVYEYAFKGSLSDYLASGGKTVNLTWTQRLQICLDIAHGINYLHTDMEGKPRIIHRDIKSENILLDENLNAKVADFGLSKFHPMKQQASTIHTKNIAGTQVYLDPEYLTTFKYKRASDIYSFGVV